METRPLTPKDESSFERWFCEIQTEGNTTVCILRKENYKVRHTVGFTASRSRVLTSLPDTSAGPNLAHPKVLLAGWERAVTVRKVPKVTDASKRPMVIKEITPFCLHLGDLQVRIWFVSCPTLGSECILHRPLREGDLPWPPEGLFLPHPPSGNYGFHVWSRCHPMAPFTGAEYPIQ